MPSVETIRVLLHVTNFLKKISGQLWTLTGPTLTNKAGLWKSDDKWNLILFEPEIFNTEDKGELDFFSHSKRIYQSANGSTYQSNFE